MNNAIYLRRAQKVWVEVGGGGLPENSIGALLKNIEPLGYTFSPQLIERLQTLSLDEMTGFYATLVETLRQLTGAHRAWKPMYPNFPQQVMEMNEWHLYFNAIAHYVTNALPTYAKKERLPLLDQTQPKIIELGSRDDFQSIFTRLVSSKTSISQSDKDDVAWLIEYSKDDIFALLPPEIALKENLAFVGAQLMRHTTQSADFLKNNFKIATDVLRLAVALSDGDVSLAESTKFKTINRAQRRLLLELLENCADPTEDMLRWKNRWIRLGEKLHVGEYAKLFPKSFAAFDVLRNDKPFATFNRQIESAVEARDSDKLVEMLRARPGDFARRLDHLLRLDASGQDRVLDEFAQVASRVSTPVLLQLTAHFKHRNSGHTLRTFFPKGNVAKVQAIENKLPSLDEAVGAAVVRICENALVERFAALPSLGACFLDEKLRDFLVPFSARSAAKSLRTLVRGSKLDLPDAKVLRFFLWWRDGKQRTDIDLSATFFDANFIYKDIVSYYNLKNYGGHHSGDIVSAPQGAAEFIDVNLETLRAKDVRYVVMSINSFTEQPFCDLPECFAGWMARTHAASGEIFEPRTVVDRIDIASDTQICLPLVADLQENRVVWMDIALRKYPSWNNVENNLSGVSLMARALTSLVKPNLYDLFALHIRARGELVSSRDAAQTVFGLDGDITPFEGDVIAAQWL